MFIVGVRIEHVWNMHDSLNTVTLDNVPLRKEAFAFEKRLSVAHTVKRPTGRRGGIRLALLLIIP